MLSLHTKSHALACTSWSRAVGTFCEAPIWLESCESEACPRTHALLSDELNNDTLQPGTRKLQTRTTLTALACDDTEPDEDEDDEGAEAKEPLP